MLFASGSPPVTLVAHGVGDLDEPGDVGAGDERGDRAALRVLGSGLPAGLVWGRNQRVLMSGLSVLEADRRQEGSRKEAGRQQEGSKKEAGRGH